MEEKIVRESHRNEIIGFDFVAVDDVVVLVSQKIIVQRERERHNHTPKHIMGTVQSAVIYNRRCDTNTPSAIGGTRWLQFYRDHTPDPKSACDSFYCFE